MPLTSRRAPSLNIKSVNMHVATARCEGGTAVIHGSARRNRPVHCFTFFSGIYTFSVDFFSTHLAALTHLAVLQSLPCPQRCVLSYNCLDGNLVLSGQHSVFFHALSELCFNHATTTTGKSTSYLMYWCFNYSAKAFRPTYQNWRSTITRGERAGVSNWNKTAGGCQTLFNAHVDNVSRWLKYCLNWEVYVCLSGHSSINICIHKFAYSILFFAWKKFSSRELIFHCQWKFAVFSSIEIVLPRTWITFHCDFTKCSCPQNVPLSKPLLCNTNCLFGFRSLPRMTDSSHQVIRRRWQMLFWQCARKYVASRLHVSIHSFHWRHTSGSLATLHHHLGQTNCYCHA